MRVISRRALREFADVHKDAETPLDDWNHIGGNKYRVATYINYRTGKVYVRHVMTHDEYSRED